MGLNIGIIIANIITLLGVIGVPIYQNYKKEKNEKKNHELKIRLGIFKTLEFLEGRCKKVLKEYNGSGDFLDYDRIPIFGLIQLKHLGEIKFYTKEYFTETYKKFIEIEKKLLEISDYKGLERTKEEYGENLGEYIIEYQEKSIRNWKKLEDIMLEIRELKNEV